MPESASFRDPSAYAVAAIAVLGATALFDGALFVLVLKHVDPAAPAAPEIWMQLHVLLRVAVAFAFLTWFDCLYANLSAIRGTTNHARWWAISGFFVPPFCLFRPCEIGVELWRAPKKDGHPIIVFAWWAAVLQMFVLFILGRGLYYLASVAAAVLAIFVVRVLTAHVEEARLENQRDERRLLREQKTAAAVRPPTAAGSEPPSAPAPAPALAPHLVAIERAAALKAAERRATVSGNVLRPDAVPFMQPDDEVAPQSPTPSTAAPAAPTPSQRPSPQDLLRPIPPERPSPQDLLRPILPDRPSPQDFLRPMPPERYSPQDMLRPLPPQRIVLPPITAKKSASAEGDSMWITIAAASSGGTAVLMFLIAARIAFRDDPAARFVAAVYAVGGVILALMAAFIGRYRSDAAADGWPLSAIAAAVVAIANLLAASWFVLQ